MKNKKAFTLKEMIIIVIATGITSIIATGIITFNNNYINVTDDEALREFIEAYANVTNSYYEEIDTDKMIDSAIDGMMQFLGDNYSVFMDQSETDALENELSGTYNGIGIEISSENKIVTVFDNSPAFNQGLKVDDVIKEVNNTPVSTNQETISIISSSDEITLKVQRGIEEIIFKLTKEIIDKPIVTSEIITTETNQNIGYIYIESFTVNVDEQFNKELLDLESKGIDSLIIDVRNNTGGYLDKTENIIEMFLDKNDIMYKLSTKGEVTTTKDSTSDNRDYKIVVVQNQASASASEILTAALKDSYGATVVGMKSYGKGKVQQVIDSDSGTSIKVTTSEWIRPNGDHIDGIGIIPDVQIEFDAETEEDDQLEKAIELLS